MSTTASPTHSDVLRAAGAGNLDADSPSEAFMAVLHSTVELLAGADERTIESTRSEAVATLERIGMADAAALVEAAFVAVDPTRSRPAATKPPASRTEPRSFRLRTLAQIEDDPQAMSEPEPVIPRAAWAGRVTLFAGREKLGKSTFASAGAAAASAGKEFLGETGKGGAVLWVGLEEHPGDAARRFRGFGADGDRVYVLDRLERPFADLTAAVEQTGAVLVVIDTLAAFTETLVDDPHSAAKWTPVMGRLTRIARDSGAAVLLLHHARKSDGAYRDSTAIGAGVDAVIEMHPGNEKSARKLEAKARWSVDDCAVRLERGRYVMASGERSIEERVQSFVESNPGCSMRALRGGVTGKGSTVD